MNWLKITIPFGLAFIVIFYMAGAVLLLISLFANPAPATDVVAKAHGLPASTGDWILLFIATLALLISFGLFSLSRWAYAITILYLGYLASVSGFMLGTYPTSIYYGNLIWSLVVIVYLILVRRCFFEKKHYGNKVI